MEFPSYFDGFLENCDFEEILKSASVSSSSLVLDSERGELVRALVTPGEKGAKAEKAMVALRNHSEAERRRRERINGHLTSLRSLIPGTNKMDKASLLAEVINHLKALRKNAAEATKGILIPMDTDEVRVEQQEDESDRSSFYIRASLCCDYRHEILSDLRQALDALHLKTVKAEIATFGSRMLNVFVINSCREESIKDTEQCQLLVNSVHRAMRSVLDNFHASQEFSSKATLSNKRQRVSFFNSSSSASFGEFW